MEKETTTGVFISVVTKDQFLHRASILSGEDLITFIGKCNKATLYKSDMNEVTGLNETEFFLLCKKLNPDFDYETDYYVVRYKPDFK